MQNSNKKKTKINNRNERKRKQNKEMQPGESRRCEGGAPADENRRLLRHLLEHNEQYKQMHVDCRAGPIGK